MAPEFHPQGHATRPAAHRGPVAAALLATLFFSCGGGSGGGYQPPPGPSQEGEEGPNGPSPLEVPGTTYYANAVTGDDHNHGLTPSSPLRTLAAAANKLSPAGGDRLCLQGTFQESLFLSGINNPVIIGRFIEADLEGQGDNPPVRSVYPQDPGGGEAHPGRHYRSTPDTSPPNAPVSTGKE